MQSRYRGRALLGLAAVAASAALLLTACSSGGESPTGDGSSAPATSPHPGTITIARPAASNGWEGDKCIDTSIILNPAVYDTLVRDQVPDGNGLAPGLAESYEWDAASNSYVFHLRKDAKFSNGQPVTAKDVAFSVDQWTSGDFSGSYYVNVDHPEVVDDYTVKIVMKKVDTFLPELLTWCTSPIYPDNFAGEDKDAYFQKPISAGPYEVQSWDDPMGTSEKITLTPNPYYYGWAGGKAPLDQIVVETIPDPSQRALQYQSGDVDILDAVDSAQATQLDPSQLVTTKPNPIQSLMVNEATPGLDNLDIRQAIALGLDRDQIAQALSNGSIPAVGALPVNVPGEVDPTTPNRYDPDKAKQLVADSGVSDPTFTLLYDSADHSTDILAQTIQSQLATIGITINLETTDDNTVNARQGDGDYELSFGGASAISPTIFDPISWIAIQYGWTGSPKASTIQDEFEAGTSTLDPAEAATHAKAVQDFITTDLGMIGLVNTTATYAAQPWVTGFQPLQYQSFYFDSLAD